VNDDQPATIADQDWDATVPSRFLRAADLASAERGWIVRIAGLSVERMRNPRGGGQDEKTTVQFDGERPLVLNKTNAKLLRGLGQAITGSTIAGAMIGHEVWLCHDPRVTVDGKTVGGIRVAGSPELRAPVDVTIAHPGRRPVTVTLRRPPWLDGPAPQPAPAPEAEHPILAWAREHGHDPAHLDELLVAGKKPTIGNLPPKHAPAAIAWLAERLTTSTPTQE